MSEFWFGVFSPPSRMYILQPVYLATYQPGLSPSVECLYDSYDFGTLEIGARFTRKRADERLATMS